MRNLSRARVGNAVAVARSGLRTVVSPQGLRGVALEVGWVTTHLALYPVGMAGERARSEVRRLRVSDLPPVQRALHVSDVEAAATPILLVHGMVDNRSIFTLLRRALRRRGFGHVGTLNYSPFTMDLRDAARVLAERVELICAETGFERIHVVGHSLGGLVARYYVQRLGGDERVHTLVTLGTPHAGTLVANAAPPVTLVRQLRPGSALLRELASAAPGCRTRLISFWSDLDQVVLPARSACVEHPDLLAQNVLVRGVGHMSLPISGRVIHEIAMALAFLDPDGSTIAAGVTPIRATGGGTREVGLREPTRQKRGQDSGI